MSPISLAKGACDLWEEKLLLDYTIEVEDEQFRVHKVVMASVSDYFKVLLSGGMKESGTDEVKLEGLSSAKVSAIIEFIYTGQFGSTEASPELLRCAVYLQVSAAIEECTKLLINKVNPENCFDILSTFQSYNLDDGVEQTIEYIKSNIDDIMWAIIPSEMSYSGFLNVMNFWKRPEWDLVNSIRELVNVDFENRHQYLNNLMTRVRFGLLTPEQLEAIKQMEIYIDSDGAWHELINKAEEYHNLPTHQKVLDDSELSRVRGEPVFTCYTVNDTSSSVFYSLHNGKYWKQHEALVTPDLYHTSISAHVTVNNYLIVCECYDYLPTTDQEWHIFDPRTLKWSTMARMKIPRQDFAVVHHEKHLYVLGGRTERSFTRPDGSCDLGTLTDAIEQYDFATNTWSVILSTLPVPVAHHRAFVIDGLIYVCGGYICSQWEFSARNDCLDLSTNTWHCKAPIKISILHQPKDVMELWGEQVLFCIDDYDDMHYYSPSADQWSVWECLPDLNTDIIRGELKDVIVDRSKNTLFLYGFQYLEKENGNGNNDQMDIDLEEFNGCVKWTVGKKGEKIKEVRLDDYPAEGAAYSELWVSIAAFLSIPPQF